MTLFETKRLIVKRFTHTDADLFFLINGDAELMRFIRAAKTRADSDAFLEENLALYRDGSVQGRYAVTIKDTGAFIGTFSFLLLEADRGVHIGYALLPAARRKGYATELVIGGAGYFFSHTVQDHLYAITAAANTDSQRVLERAGFLWQGNIHQRGEELQLFCLDR